MAHTDDFTEAQYLAVTKLVDDKGEKAAATALEVSVGTLLRVLARRQVQKGTVLLIQRSLERLGAAPSAA